MRISSLLLLVALLCVMPSCRKGPRQYMVGTWRIAHLELPPGMNAGQKKTAAALPGASYIVYKDDSTYHAEMIKIIVEGKWHLDSNNTVLMTIAKDGRIAKMKILHIDKDSVVLHNIAGDLDYYMTMVPYSIDNKR